MSATRVSSNPNALILGCVSTKNAGPAKAKDLYASALWAKRRRYAEESGLPWVIFSAKHGILDPDDHIEWYDVALKAQPADVRARMGRDAAAQLAKRFTPIRGMTFEIHAGAAYASALAEPLKALGARLTNRMEGLAFGYQLQRYDELAAGSGTPRLRAASGPRGVTKTRLPLNGCAFKLQFDPKLIKRFARQYSYGGDDFAARLGAQARAEAISRVRP